MKFDIIGAPENAKVTVEQTAEKDGVLFFDLDMVLEEEAIPKKLTLKWAFDAIDTLCTWSAAYDTLRYLRPNFGTHKTHSRIASGMPLHCHFSRDGRNRQTIAVADAKNPISFASGVNEYTASLDCYINFFTVSVAPIKEYHTTIRVDLRDIPYEQAVKEVSKWWETDCGYTPAFVPEHAKLPMNSSWYTYHRGLDEEDIIRECELSKPLGMETILIDDGWQKGDDYSRLGDWIVNTDIFPDFKNFVDRIHKIGMKVMLWFSVPFVGRWDADNHDVENNVYKRFKGMFLNDSGVEWVLHFDPRYKEVRDYLIGIYVNAVKTYGLDGVKLDFIDCFRHTDVSLKPDDKRDIKSLEEAINTLMIDIHNALTEINPDILIEFREPYIGPCIRQFGNMLRVHDCAIDALINRADSINLRIVSGNTAVHSDMLMWNKNEAVEIAAMQITNCIYCVPQISVKIQELPEDHKKMLGFYLDFWRKNRDILAYGDIFAKNPETNYSMAWGVKDGNAVITAYTDSLVEVGDLKTAKIINSTRYDALVIENAEGRDFEVVNCMGEVLETGKLNTNLVKINVPLSGIIFIK